MFEKHNIYLFNLIILYYLNKSISAPVIMVPGLVKPVDPRLRTYVLCGDFSKNYINSQMMYFKILFNTTTSILGKHIPIK